MLNQFPKATVFTQPNCLGNSFSLKGQFTCLDAKHSIKSIIVNYDLPTPGCLWVYSEACLSGEKFEICSSISDLNEVGWGSKIGSIVMGSNVKSYTLYTEANKLGHSLTKFKTLNVLSSPYYHGINSIQINK